MNAASDTDGHSRIGFLDLPQAPILSATFEQTQRGIVLVVPYAWNTDPSRQLDRWFHGGAVWGDDPNKDKFDYAPPAEIDFVDSQGRIALLGCRATGGSMTTMVNEGRIAAQYAVFGALGAARYTSINGMRSEMEGLGTWMNLSSLRVEPKWDADSRLKSVTLELDSPEPISISRALNLCIRPAFRYGPSGKPDETVISERMIVESDVRSPRDWSEHLNLHFAIRDLVRLASWRSLDFVSHEVTRDDDPLRMLDGSTRGKQWLQATISTPPDPKGAKINYLDFLFTYDQIGRRGISNWLEMRRRWGRALDPVLALLDLRGAPLDVHFAQLCIGLEALGYLLAVEQGAADSAAGRQTFRQRLSLICGSVACPLGFDAVEWVDSASRSYRRVKHADNPVPETGEMYASYYRGLSIFRLWVAERLGAVEAEIYQASRRDRVSRVAEAEVH